MKTTNATQTGSFLQLSYWLGKNLVLSIRNLNTWKAALLDLKKYEQ